MDVSRSTFNAVGGNQYNQSNPEQPSYAKALEKFCARKVAGAAFNSAERYGASKCLPATRVEVREKLRQWIDEVHNPPICWLRGPVGSGKSTIAQSIAEECDESEELGASFFFDPASADRRDITDFVPTLAYQLSIKVPQTKPLMQKAFEDDPSIPDQSRQYQLKKLIVDPLLKLGQALSHKVVVVVDGLDQYDGRHWVEELIVLLTEACRNVQLPLRFLLTSQLDVCFVGLPEASTKHVYPLALETFDTHLDFQKFFQAEFKKIHERYRLGSMQDVPESWPSHADIEQLVTKSSGLFALASIIVKFVNINNRPYSQLQAVLASPGDGSLAGATHNSPHDSFIDHLVDLLASEDISIQAGAATGLANATGVSGGAKAAFHANAIQILIGLLRSGNESVLIEACRALVNIITHVDSARAKCLNADALPLLIHLLSSHGIQVQRAAIFPLVSIITLQSQEPAESATLILDAIPVFVGLLACQDTKTQASAAAVLKAIVGRGGTKEVVKARAIPSLVDLLEKSSDPVVLAVACTALRDIWISDSVGAEALDVDSIIPPVVHLLSFSNDLVQRCAAFTLMDITLHERAVAAVLSSNAIPNLVLLLRSEDIHIQASAAAVLENITVRDGTGAEDATEAQAIPPLVHLLKSPDTTVLIAVCAALRSITSPTSKARAEALDAGAVPLLEHLLGFSSDRRIQASAKAVLENINFNAPSRASVLMSGAGMSLVETPSAIVTFLIERLLVIEKEGVGVG